MKKLLTAAFSLCLALNMAAPTFALEKNISAPRGPTYGVPTSVDVLFGAPIEAQRSGFDGERRHSGMSELSTLGGSEGYGACVDDGGAARSEDVSKSAALIPPHFGSPSAYALNTGEYLTPNLAPRTKTATDVTVGGGMIRYPDATFVPTAFPVATSTTAFTDVTSDLYYSGGYLATLKIPAIGVNVKVYEGTDSSTLAKGAGHFEETSIWDGRVAIAGHNRGANCYFGVLHTLSIGDRITLTTRLGTRTYAVTGISKISETDRSGLAPTVDNTLSLYTCVRDQSGYRWCVTAAQIL